MRLRVVVLLVLTLVGTSLLATSTAAAAGHPPDVRGEVKKIIRDCARDDDLDRHYSLRALRRALRVLPDDIRHYTGCERAIRRAIRRAKNQLFREVRQIFRDCARDDDLDRHYSLQALRLALRFLPDDLRDYTDCERAIRRAIRHAKDHDHHGGGHDHGGGHHPPGHRPKAARAT